MGLRRCNGSNLKVELCFDQYKLKGILMRATIRVMGLRRCKAMKVINGFMNKIFRDTS